MEIWLLSFISAVNLVTSGYLTGHHPLPPNLISSGTVIGSAAGDILSSGVYSSSQLTQTISTSPHHIQSSISTHHPSNYDSRSNQISYQSGHNQRRLNENPARSLSQFTPNRLYNPRQTNNYNTNHPSVIRPGNYNQDQEVYRQRHALEPQNNYGGY